jgi:CRP-like cAMP-binding protein
VANGLFLLLLRDRYAASMFSQSANLKDLVDMIKQKLELLVLGCCAVLGLIWAITTDYFPHLQFQLDWLIDISSLLAVASFSVSGMLPLRILAVSSQGVAIPYFILQSTSLWTPAGWTALFMVINLYHITRILLERRPVKFPPDEEQLYDLAFTNFDPREFRKLLKVGKWKTACQGDRIFSEGDFITQIVVPISGSVSAVIGGRKIGTLGPGELIGAAIVLTNQRSAFFEATFTEDCRYMCWSKSDLERFIEKNPGLSRKFNDVVNRHLVNQINKLTFELIGGTRMLNSSRN